MTQIVRAMKDFSHPGQGLAETDLDRAVESAPRVGLVSCFEGELKQAVLNVIVNAAQAIGQQIEDSTRPGQGTIAVCTRRDGDAVQIVITDDGPGMDEVTRSRVFDPFFTTGLPAAPPSGVAATDVAAAMIGAR